MCIRLDRNSWNFLCLVSTHPSVRYVPTGPQTASLEPVRDFMDRRNNASLVWSVNNNEDGNVGFPYRNVEILTRIPPLYGSIWKDDWSNKLSSSLFA